MTAWMRAFHAQSPSGSFAIWDTSNPAHALGMSPMDSPSVFNFYPPDFTPAGSPLAASGLVAPELKITSASSVVGYANYIRQIATSQGAAGDPDVFAPYPKELAVAADPAALANRLNQLLAYGSLSSTSLSLIEDAVNAVPLPAGNTSAALQQRVWIGVTLALCAPEFIVQK